MKHLNITVSGRVQGVFFRASTADVARELGIRGWVCNQADGSVYLEAEGEESVLQDLLDWLRKGPPQASVTEVSAESGALQHFEDFEVRS